MRAVEMMSPYWCNLSKAFFSTKSKKPERAVAETENTVNSVKFLSSRGSESANDFMQCTLAGIAKR